jgi:hypothetical protein
MMPGSERMLLAELERLRKAQDRLALLAELELLDRRLTEVPERGDRDALEERREAVEKRLWARGR